MLFSNHDSIRKLAKKIGADPGGKTIEDTLNNIAVKFGATPVHHKGTAPVIDRITEVVDLDIMHNLGTLEVTPTTEARTITPEKPVDGYSEVSVSAVTSAIDENIVAGNIKKDVTILGVTGSYEGSGGETFEVDITIDTDNDSQTITANKTYSQVMAAHASGKKIVINYNVTISSEYGVINELWYIGTFIDELGEHSDGSSCLVSGFGMDITYTQPSENRTKATSLLKWFDPAKVGTMYNAEFKLEVLNYESP